MRDVNCRNGSRVLVRQGMNRREELVFGSGIERGTRLAGSAFGSDQGLSLVGKVKCTRER